MKELTEILYVKKHNVISSVLYPTFASSTSRSSWLERCDKRTVVLYPLVRPRKKTELLFPDKKLTGDNSIMIGMAGYLEFMKNKGKVMKMSKIKADGNLRLK